MDHRRNVEEKILDVIFSIPAWLAGVLCFLGGGMVVFATWTANPNATLSWWRAMMVAVGIPVAIIGLLPLMLWVIWRMAGNPPKDGTAARKGPVPWSEESRRYREANKIDEI